jgi:hypothetical protein
MGSEWQLRRRGCLKMGSPFKVSLVPHAASFRGKGTSELHRQARTAAQERSR